jgi:hypothetical protein
VSRQKEARQVFLPIDEPDFYAELSTEQIKDRSLPVVKSLGEFVMEIRTEFMPPSDGFSCKRGTSWLMPDKSESSDPQLVEQEHQQTVKEGDLLHFEGRTFFFVEIC